MSEFKLQATVRSDVGKGASRRLRHSGLVPAIVYGGNKTPTSVTLEHNTLWNVLAKDERIFTSIIDLEIAGKSEQVVIKDLHRHPYANKLLHVDFQRITKNQFITKRVPLAFVGKSKSPGVKLGALLTPLMQTLDVYCLPENLPDRIEIDCANLNAGDSLKMSEILLPKGVVLSALRKGGDEYNHAVVVLGKART